MKTNRIATLCCGLLFACGAAADEASQKEAAKLMNAMEMEVAFERSIEQMVEVQINRNPSILPYKDVMRQFFQKYMSYEELKPEIIKLYADAFSAEELREINAFYASPTGKKTIKLMPDLMTRGAEVGSRRIQANIQELQQMIQAESERLQREAQQAGDPDTANDTL